MHERELNEIWKRLELLERSEARAARELRVLQEEFHRVLLLIRHIIRYLEIHESPPSAGTLTGAFTPGDPMSSMLLNATPATTRQDGSALAPTDIASITYQKTSLVGSPPAPGPLQQLQTNQAQPGAGLASTDLTFTDANSVPGDDYTFFVTDVQGHIGAASNDVVVPQQQSAPAAGTLTGTFTP